MHMHTHAQKHTQAHTHTHTHKHIHAHTLLRKQPHTHTHKHAFSLTHTLSLSRTHTHTHTHTHTQTHTHTRTHMRAYYTMMKWNQKIRLAEDLLEFENLPSITQTEATTQTELTKVESQKSFTINRSLKAFPERHFIILLRQSTNRFHCVSRIFITWKLTIEPLQYFCNDFRSRDPAIMDSEGIQ